MERVLLVKIDSLQARAVQDNGLKFRYKRRDFVSGPIVAHLDETASPPANLGLINVSTGEIRLSWAIIATIPLTPAALAAGELSDKEGGLLRMTFDETGKVLEDGSGFDAFGGGTIGSGSLFSGALLASQSNFARVTASTKKTPHLARTLTAGGSVSLVLIPESFLDVTLPKSLGGETQRLNLTGVFTLSSILALGNVEGAKRSRR